MRHATLLPTVRSLWWTELRICERDDVVGRGVRNGNLFHFFDKAVVPTGKQVYIARVSRLPSQKPRELVLAVAFFYLPFTVSLEGGTGISSKARIGFSLRIDAPDAYEPLGSVKP